MGTKAIADEARAEAAANAAIANAAQPAATASALLGIATQDAGVLVAAGASGVVVGPTGGTANNTDGRLLVLYSSSGAAGAGLTGLELQLQMSIDGGGFIPISSDIQCGGVVPGKIGGSSFVWSHFAGAGTGHTVAFQVVASPTGGSYTTGTAAEGVILVIQLL